MLKLVLLILAETHSASWLYAIAEWLGNAARPIAVAVIIATAILVAILKNTPPIRSRRLGVERSHQRPVPFESGQQKVRRNLLKIIQREINCRLETLLHERVKLDLHIEDQRQHVGNLRESVPQDMPEVSKTEITSLNRFLQPFRTHTAAPIPLASTQKIRDVFVQPDIQGKLLILGEPGSGKTTTLLHLAKDLIQAASKDDSLLIPVLLELSTWSEDKSIEQWITEAIEKRYGISISITQQWQNNLLPLLDGLDELGLLKQQKCISAINAFLREKAHHGLVVCCRRQDYEASQVALDTLKGVIYLEPLRPEQIQAFFQQLNRPQLWESIRADSALRELAQKPLFLSMLVVAHQSNTITSDAELFDAFIIQKLKENNSNIYSPSKEPSHNQTRVYLAWLAQQLESARKPEFLIEGLQPCMLRRNQIHLYQLIYGSIYGLCFGLYFGLYGGLLFGLLFGLSAGLKPSRQLSEKLIFSCSKALRKGLRFGLRAGLLVGLTLGLSWGLFAWLFAGLLAGLLLLLIIGLSFGLLVGLLVGLISGLSSGLIDEKTFPNQGIWRSLQHSIIIILIFGLSFGLSFGLFFGLGFGLEGWLYSDLRERLLFGLKDGLNMGFPLGLSIGLLYTLIGGPAGNECLELSGGLQAVVQHLALRIVLTQSGNTPWNYARFLNYAVELRFIQRVGGRYRFTHDLLRQHFAVMGDCQNRRTIQ